jgi:hypothetical protein
LRSSLRRRRVRDSPHQTELLVKRALTNLGRGRFEMARGRSREGS